MSELLSQLHLQARQVAGSLRLPLRQRRWRGIQGNWQGTGSGSSLDFQDHRPYSPGDDPRGINWQAFARSGNYTMKIYRQEVSPTLDLVIDLSPSMFADDAKSARVAELLYWCVESALHAGAGLRCYAWIGAQIEPLTVDQVLSHRWHQQAPAADVGAISEVPFRHGSMRVLISDLLWPGDSQPLFHHISSGQGFGIIYAPFSQDESDPSWSGNLEMLDCESAEVRIQRVDADLLQKYREAYGRHFALWQEQSMRYHAPLARVPANIALAEALQAQAAEIGAVEWIG